jgi:hypothetical protein
MRKHGLTLCVLLIALPLLSGCMTARPDVRPIVTVKCASVKAISGSQQKAAAQELDALPQNSVIANVIVPQWVQMRDEARACRANK